jgi:hypothetical protein
MEKYHFRKGARISGFTADEVGQELERIRKANGGKLATETVVAEATPEDALLHNHFEWDDLKAGHEYRLIQARTLVKVVVVKHGASIAGKFVEGEPRSKYVHVQSEEGGYYQDLIVAVGNVDEYQAALRETTTRLTSAENAVNELKAAAARGKRKGDRVYINMAVDAIAAAKTAIGKIPIAPSRPQANV